MNDSFKFENISTSTSVTVLRINEVKSYIRQNIGETKDDDELSMLIDSAIEDTEEFTGRMLSTQTIKVYYNDFPDDPNNDFFQLPVSPLRSIPSTGFVYTNSTGGSSVFSSTKYDVDSISKNYHGRLVLKYDDEWPSDTLATNNPISIECNVGYKSSELPKNIKHAMLLYIGTYFENRENFIKSPWDFKELPLTSKGLLKKYRMKRYK